MSVPANSITTQLQEWWNLTPGGPLRTLDANVVVESPFWDDRKRSPLRDITPNGDDPKKILIDLAHTYAIQGWGKDYLASAIVFLSVHCKVWGTHGDYKSKLDRAWGSFKSWCVSNRKTTSIEDFSPQCLKIKSYLVNIVHFSCSKCVLVSTSTLAGGLDLKVLSIHLLPKAARLSQGSWKRLWDSPTWQVVGLYPARVEQRYSPSYLEEYVTFCGFCFCMPWCPNPSILLYWYLDDVSRLNVAICWMCWSSGTLPWMHFLEVFIATASGSLGNKRALQCKIAGTWWILVCIYCRWWAGVPKGSPLIMNM